MGPYHILDVSCRGLSAAVYRTNSSPPYHIMDCESSAVVRSLTGIFGVLMVIRSNVDLIYPSFRSRSHHEGSIAVMSDAMNNFSLFSCTSVPSTPFSTYWRVDNFGALSTHFESHTSSRSTVHNQYHPIEDGFRSWHCREKTC